MNVALTKKRSRCQLQLADDSSPHHDSKCQIDSNSSTEIDSNLNNDDLPAERNRLEKIAVSFRTILEVLFPFKCFFIVWSRNFLWIFQCLGEDPSREGLVDTPMRAAKALNYFCSGYRQTAEQVIGSGVFNEATDNNVVCVKNIDIYSLCEHHMVPFTGKVCVLC